MNNSLKIFFLTLLAFLAGMLFVCYILIPEPTKELSQSEIEEANPKDFVELIILIDKETLGYYVITGKFKSKATVTTYKDMEITIGFKSKTGTELGREAFTLYEFLSPGGEQGFTFEPDIPNNTEDFTYGLTSVSIAD